MNWRESELDRFGIPKNLLKYVFNNEPNAIHRQHITAIQMQTNAERERESDAGLATLPYSQSGGPRAQNVQQSQSQPVAAAIEADLGQIWPLPWLLIWLPCSRRDQAHIGNYELWK